MKKAVYFLLFIMVSAFLQCRKDSTSEEIDPQPEVNNPDDASKILRNITVPEAESVTFDSLRSLFLVRLPAAFSADEISINLSLYPDVSLLDSTSGKTTNTNLKFSYKGNRPLNLIFTKKGISTTRRYDIYVEAQGMPKIGLSKKEIEVKQGVSYIPFKVVSGLGTIPSKPEEKSPVIKMADPSTNVVLEGTVQNVLQNIYFEDLTGLINAGKVALEITFDGADALRFEGLQLKRGIPRAELSNMPFSLGSMDTLKIRGGYFDPNAKYTAALTNDFQSGPTRIDLTFEDKSNVYAKLGSGLPEAVYLVTFYENGNEMGKGAFDFSNAKTNTLETLWKGDPALAFRRNVQPLVFTRGDEFYAKPSLVQYAWGSNLPTSSFDVKLLPALRLTLGAYVIDLTPEITVISWAVAGVSYAVGRYKLPENMQAGSYAVTALYPNQPETKPYWSKMQIR